MSASFPLPAVTATHGAAVSESRPERLRLVVSMPLVVSVSLGLWYGLYRGMLWLLG